MGPRNTRTPNPSKMGPRNRRTPNPSNMGAPQQEDPNPWSGKNRRLSAVDQVEVDCGAEARSFEGVDHPLAVHLDVLRQAVLLSAGRQQHLEHLAVLDGHD